MISVTSGTDCVLRFIVLSSVIEVSNNDQRCHVVDVDYTRLTSRTSIIFRIILALK